MNILTSLIGYVKTFLSSNYVSYGIIAILSLGGYALYKDYTNTMKENGQLKTTLELANAGTKQASDLANQNAETAKEIQKHFQELLYEVQRMEQERRELEESLREKENAFDEYKRKASKDIQQCLKLQMPREVFGSYVVPSVVGGDGKLPDTKPDGM